MKKAFIILVIFAVVFMTTIGFICGQAYGRNEAIKNIKIVSVNTEEKSIKFDFPRENGDGHHTHEFHEYKWN